MTEYNDPGRHYKLAYPDGWLPLTQEGTPHISFASLVTGGYLRIEALEGEPGKPETVRPEATLRSFLACEDRARPNFDVPAVKTLHRTGAASAYVTFTRPEPAGPKQIADFGHTRAWAFARGNVQVRCVYRCRATDAGVDDLDLDSILGSLVIQTTTGLTADNFARYYFSVLKRSRPKMVNEPPRGLTLTLSDGQTILLEHLYNHYVQEPEKIDELIDGHMRLLDFCGDDVPDLTNFKLIKPLLFPKLFRSSTDSLPPHRLPLWPGLALGAVIQGSIFNYGVNFDRLRAWGVSSLADIHEHLMDNLYAISPASPRGLRNDSGSTTAISYVDHPFSASFILFEDFYETTVQNLGTREFLVGLPDPSCLSCFREENPRFVVKHTAMLRLDYHRSVDRLTDTIYQVTGPSLRDVKPFDILQSCAKAL